MSKKYDKLTPNQNTILKDDDVNAMTNDEIEMIQRVKESLVETYVEPKIHSPSTPIPYFTNEVDNVYLFKETKCPKYYRETFSLSSILKSMIARMADMSESDFNQQVGYDHVLLHLKYPMVKDVGGKIPVMIWHSEIIDRETYKEFVITDVMLYNLVKRYSSTSVSVQGSDSLYIMGDDILMEANVFDVSILDEMFQTLTKTIFITTLLAKNTDIIDLTAFPTFHFGFGTYKEHQTKANKKFYVVPINNSQLHIVPLWDSVINISYTLELRGANLNFSYKKDTFLSIFPETYVNELPLTTDRTHKYDKISADVTLFDYDASVTREEVYTANIQIRNKIASTLNNMKKYNYIKDKMFPKDKLGAKTKLRWLLNTLKIHDSGSVLDIGCAPGTWMDELMTRNFKIIDGITRQDANDLMMYPTIANRINSDSRCSVTYGDVCSMNPSNFSKYDLIVSDAATGKASYINQAYEHDTLFTSILRFVPRLCKNGTFIMKTYDLTPLLLQKIKSFVNLFAHIYFLKPDGSCPVNSEMYLVMQGYQSGGCEIKEIVKSAQSILYNQIQFLDRLITNGFKQTIDYTLSYFSSRINIKHSKNISKAAKIMLASLNFSDSMFPNHLTGRLDSEESITHDVFLRFTWDAPKYGYDDQPYITETHVPIEVKGTYLDQLLVFHIGRVYQNGRLKPFLLVERDLSPLFGDYYGDMYITDEHIHDLPLPQISFSSLLASSEFKTMFPNCVDFSGFCQAFKFLYLSNVVEFLAAGVKSNLCSALRQFFREAETMRLFYTQVGTQTRISNQKRYDANSILNLSKTSDRRKFATLYYEESVLSSNLRQIFNKVLNKYSIQVPHNEFTSTRITHVNKLHKERNTGQICISQPACIQFRRQNSVQRLH